MTLEETGRVAGEELRRTTRDMVDPSVRLADLQRLRAARGRARVGATTALVLVVGAVGWLSLRPGSSSSSTVPAAPTPTTTVTTPSSPRLLPPLCGPNRFDVMGTPDNQSRECPSDMVAGTYRSAVTGLHLAWPFTVTLPAGWQATALKDYAGVDLAAGDNTASATPFGVTVLPYATPLGTSSAVWSASRLRHWLADQASVRVSGARTTTLDGFPAWQLDVRAAADAPFTTRCRHAARCLPVLGAAFAGSNGLPSQVPVVELTPGTTSRLLTLKAANNALPVTVWIWNTGGPAGTQALDVAESLAFEPGHDPVAVHVAPAR